MLKFSTSPSRNKRMSYANGCASEYIGCHIFESVGILVQKTLLGTYNKTEKKKIVVACKDLTSTGIVLQDFASLKNTIIDSEHNGYYTGGSSHFKLFRLGFCLAVFLVAPLVLLSLGRTEGLFPRLETLTNSACPE